MISIYFITSEKQYWKDREHLFSSILQGSEVVLEYSSWLGSSLQEFEIIFARMADIHLVRFHTVHNNYGYYMVLGNIFSEGKRSTLYSACEDRILSIWLQLWKRIQFFLYYFWTVWYFACVCQFHRLCCQLLRVFFCFIKMQRCDLKGLMWDKTTGNYF